MRERAGVEVADGLIHQRSQGATEGPRARASFLRRVGRASETTLVCSGLFNQRGIGDGSLSVRFAE